MSGHDRWFWDVCDGDALVQDDQGDVGELVCRLCWVRLPSRRRDQRCQVDHDDDVNDAHKGSPRIQSGIVGVATPTVLC